MPNLVSSPDDCLAMFAGNCQEFRIRENDITDFSSGNSPRFANWFIVIDNNFIQQVGDSFEFLGQTFTVATGASTANTYDGTIPFSQAHGQAIVAMFEKNYAFSDFDININLNSLGWAVVEVKARCYETLTDFQYNEDNLTNPYGFFINQGRPRSIPKNWKLLFDIFCDGQRIGKTIARTPVFIEKQDFHPAFFVFDISHELMTLPPPPPPEQNKEDQEIIPFKRIEVAYGSQWQDEDCNVVYGEYCKHDESYDLLCAKLPVHGIIQRIPVAAMSDAVDVVLTPELFSESLEEVNNQPLSHRSSFRLIRKICRDSDFYFQTFLNHRRVYEKAFPGANIIVDHRFTIRYFNEVGQIGLRSYPLLLNDGIFCAPIGFNQLDPPPPAGTCQYHILLRTFVTVNGTLIRNGDDVDLLLDLVIRFKPPSKCSGYHFLFKSQQRGIWETFDCMKVVSKGLDVENDIYCEPMTQKGLIGNRAAFDGDKVLDGFSETNTKGKRRITFEIDQDTDPKFLNLVEDFFLSEWRLLKHKDELYHRQFVIEKSNYQEYIRGQKPTIQFTGYYSDEA